jgi:hypothetical protein
MGKSIKLGLLAYLSLVDKALKLNSENGLAALMYQNV